jgi:hypothetical protein
MYHFTLPVCVGRDVVEGDRKQVHAFETEREFERWFTAGAAEFGVKPLMLSAALKMMRFKHRETTYRIDYATLDGALEVADPERMKRCLLYGLGSHRRAGLGMMQLSI